MDAFFSTMSFSVEAVKNELRLLILSEPNKSFFKATHVIDITPLFTLKDPIVLYAERIDKQGYSDILKVVFSEEFMDDIWYANFIFFFLKESESKEFERIKRECKNAFSDGTIHLQLVVSRVPVVKVTLVFTVQYCIEPKNNPLKKAKLYEMSHSGIFQVTL
jgi:hypothetical protein